MILDGKYVKHEKEKLEIKDKLISRLENQGVIEQLQKLVPLSVEALELKVAYDFTVPDYRNNGEVDLGRIVAIRANERVQIKNVFVTDKDHNIKEELIMIDVVKGAQTVQTYILEEGKLVLDNEFEYIGNFLDDTIDLEQIDNEEYEGVLAKNFPFSFCLAGGYRHCGPGCGDGLARGGGTPINAIDSCCRGHDRCWANFGNGDACCDKILVDCAKANRSAGSVASDMIVLYFSGNAKKC